MQILDRIKAQVQQNTISGRFPSVMGVLYFITFAIFFLVSFRSGAAITGKIVIGHYYVGQHGSYTEVSRGFFIFSACLTALAGLETPLLACSWIWHHSRAAKQPIWHPVYLVASLLSLLVGLAFFFGSIHCILSAVSRSNLNVFGSQSNSFPAFLIS